MSALGRILKCAYCATKVREEALGVVYACPKCGAPFPDPAPDPDPEPEYDYPPFHFGWVSLGAPLTYCSSTAITPYPPATRSRRR